MEKELFVALMTEQYGAIPNFLSLELTMMNFEASSAVLHLTYVFQHSFLFFRLFLSYPNVSSFHFYLTSFPLLHLTSI